MRLARRPPEERTRRRRLARRMIVMLIAVAFVFGAVFGFQYFRDQMIRRYLAANRAPPVAVAAERAGTAAWQPRLEAIGSLRAVNGIEVSTEVAGVIESINFRNGDTAAAGDVLVQLNADPDQAQLDAARVAAELAEVAFRRAKEQFAVQAISRAALDTAAAELKSSRAQVQQQEALLARKTIRAPFAGRLGISNVSIGQYVNPGQAIVTLQTIDPIYVDFTLPQQQLAQIALDQPLTVTTNVYPEHTFAGRITAIAPRVDPATRNLQLQGMLPNPKSELLPGMFASVSVQVGAEQPQLTLPQTAISYNPYGSTVYVLEPTPDRNPQGEPIYTARQRFVETGERRGNAVAILSGVSEGELVVTAGQLKLRNGAPAVLADAAKVSEGAVRSARSAK
ncbi:MAG TPA: efflux RND transporter periplasmic adaptor subunit [Burkholderiales bacterium]